MMPVLLLSCGKDEGMTERKRPHKAVDLGLSVLWAETNIGAREEYDFGWYFGRGSVVERQASFSWKTYPYAETVEEGKISTEVKKGWMLNGRLLRAAQVVVSAGKAEG